MANGLYMDTEMMNDVGTSSGALTEEYEQRIKELESRERELMSLWNGQAATEFDRGFLEHMKVNEQLQSVLGEMSGKIMEGSNRFRTTEDENVADSRKLMDNDYQNI